MRLTDLLDCEVIAADGRSIGCVSDIRIVQDGPIVRGMQAAFRVEALVVGRGGLAERLGYIRGRIEGPWLLKAIFTRLERRASIVPASAIVAWTIDERRLQMAPGTTVEPGRDL